MSINLGNRRSIDMKIFWRVNCKGTNLERKRLISGKILWTTFLKKINLEKEGVPLTVKAVMITLMSWLLQWLASLLEDLQVEVNAQEKIQLTVGPSLLIYKNLLLRKLRQKLNKTRSNERDSNLGRSWKQLMKLQLAQYLKMTMEHGRELKLGNTCLIYEQLRNYIFKTQLV